MLKFGRKKRDRVDHILVGPDINCVSSTRLHYTAEYTLCHWKSPNKHNEILELIFVTVLHELTLFVSQVQELHEEEAQWVNYDEDELFVKMQLADSIFDSLLKDTANVLTLIHDKRAKRDNISSQLS